MRIEYRSRRERRKKRKKRKRKDEITKSEEKQETSNLRAFYPPFTIHIGNILVTVNVYHQHSQSPLPL